MVAEPRRWNAPLVSNLRIHVRRESGVRSIDFLGPERRAHAAGRAAILPRPHCCILDEAARQLRAYFAGSLRAL